MPEIGDLRYLNRDFHLQKSKVRVGQVGKVGRVGVVGGRVNNSPAFETSWLK